jgi:hypothetical protein
MQGAHLRRAAAYLAAIHEETSSRPRRRHFFSADKREAEGSSQVMRYKAEILSVIYQRNAKRRQVQLPLLHVRAEYEAEIIAERTTSNLRSRRC